MLDSQQNLIDAIDDMYECLERLKQEICNIDGWSNKKNMRINYLSGRFDAALDNYDLVFRLYLKEAASARTQDGSLNENPFTKIIPQNQEDENETI